MANELKPTYSPYDIARAVFEAADDIIDFVEGLSGSLNHPMTLKRGLRARLLEHLSRFISPLTEDIDDDQQVKQIIAELAAYLEQQLGIVLADGLDSFSDVLDALEDQSLRDIITEVLMALFGVSTPGESEPDGDSPPTDEGVDMMDHFIPEREPIIFVDIDQRNKTALSFLLSERFKLIQKKREMQNVLEPQDKDELTRLETNLRIRRDLADPERDPENPIIGDARFGGVIFDRLFIEIRQGLKYPDNFAHTDGKFPSQLKEVPDDYLADDEEKFAAIFGILLRENVAVPPYPLPVGQRFYDTFSLARAEYEGNLLLYRKALKILLAQGDLPGEDPAGRFVFAREWAQVVQTLRNKGIAYDNAGLVVHTNIAISGIKGADDGAPPSTIAIDLPDLEEQADVEIVEDNLHAMQAIYFSSMLEELHVFQVVDKLVELFQMGMLPLGKGEAGNMLYRYMKESVTRLSEYERRNLYARTLGFAGGDSYGNPNREFQMLWLRFVSAVSSFARKFQLDNLLRAAIPAGIHQEQVRKAGRDLAANLSLFGYGMAYFAATELQGQINAMIRLLSHDEIKAAYGARDMWQVVDQVAMLELGGARDSVRYRTMASSGAIIVRWLAKNAKELASVSMQPILDTNEILNPTRPTAGSKPTLDPTDFDLVNACERWLAVTGTPETQIEEYAGPYESPATTSRPVQIPSVARELLESAGIMPNNGFPGI